MKPLGPIPAGFSAIDGELAIGGRKASDLVAEAGTTPLFVYSRDMLRGRVAALRAAMPARLKIHYAIKANPWRPVLEEMAGLVDGFDVASAGELAMVRAAGIDSSLVSFAGPGKRDEELKPAITDGCTVNLESEAEARRALAIGERPNQSPWMTVTNDAVKVRTAQSRLFVRARVGGSGALSVVNVPILVELASAEARLDSIACQPQGVDLEVRSGVGQIAIAEIDEDDLHEFTQPLELGEAQLVNAVLLRVSAFSQLSLGGDEWQTARFSASDIADREVKTVQTQDLARSLTASLIEETEIDVRLLGLGLGSRDLIGRQVGTLLEGLAGPLDELLLAVSAITGARLGEADVRVTGLRCGAPVLVG